MSPVTLSGIEWLGLVTIIGLLATVIGFMFKREICAIDRMTDATNGLTHALAEFKLFVSENYVTGEKHDRDIDEVKVTINGWAQRFEHQLERHETTCPGKNR